MTPLIFLAQGAGLGLTAAGTPGPLQALLISQTLGWGWRRGLPLALAPLIADAPIVLLTTFLLGQLPALALRLIGVTGGLFVLYLARQLVGQWRAVRGLPAGGATGPNGTAQIGMRQAVLVNYASPGPYVFWALVNGPLLLEALDQSAGHAIAFLAGFYGVFIAGMGLMVLAFDRARRLGPRLTAGLMLATIAVLVLFGALLLWRGLVG